MKTTLILLILILSPLFPLARSAAENPFLMIKGSLVLNLEIAKKIIVPPGEDVPKEVASFSGLWVGQIRNQEGIQPHMPIVQETNKDRAKVICGFGKSRGWWDQPQPAEFWSREAKIKKGELIVQTPHGNHIIYELNKQGTQIEVILKGCAKIAWCGYQGA